MLCMKLFHRASQHIAPHINALNNPPLMTWHSKLPCIWALNHGCAIFEPHERVACLRSPVASGCEWSSVILSHASRPSMSFCSSAQWTDQALCIVASEQQVTVTFMIYTYVCIGSSDFIFVKTSIIWPSLLDACWSCLTSDYTARSSYSAVLLVQSLWRSNSRYR